MPATEIVVQDQQNHAVSLATLVAAASEMFFQNNGFCKLIVKTGATASGNMVVKSRADSNRRTGDVTVALAANKVYESSFFEVMLFNKNGGTVDITFSAVTDVEIGVIRQRV